MTEYKEPNRINDILLGNAERAALQWLVERMPAWIFPDLLTGFGLFGALVIFAGYVLSNLDKNFLWLASLGFLMNWLGDSLDGNLARYRKIERPQYGFFVDHIIDSFVDVLVFLGLGLSPFVDFKIACLALISYLLLSIYVFLSTSVNGVFRISFGHFGPTEMRVLAILMNVGMYFIANPLIHFSVGSIKLFDLTAAVVAVGILIVYILASVNLSRELAHKESKRIQKI
jgi:phosphatidylglycerophosphate synthase